MIYLVFLIRIPLISVIMSPKYSIGCCNALSAHHLKRGSRRCTTRVGDMAYCLLSILDVNMALLYGEGISAFVRLQEVVIKVSADQSIWPASWQTLPHHFFQDCLRYASIACWRFLIHDGEPGSKHKSYLCNESPTLLASFTLRSARSQYEKSNT